MKRLPTFLIVATCLWSIDGYAHTGHKPKRMTKRSHLSHSSHEHSPWTISLGLTAFKSLGGESNDKAAGSEAGGGHQHLQLDGGSGHDHGDTSSQDERSSSSTETSVAASIGYRLNQRLSLNLVSTYALADGINDPALGASYFLPVGKDMTGAASVAATAPVSKISRESYKTTTVTASAGPIWKRSPYEIQARGYVAMSFYSKTIVIEEEPTEAALIVGNDGMSIQGEDVDPGIDDAQDAAELGTGVREFNRYGAGVNGGFAVANDWRIGAGLGMAYVTYQFADPMIETQATVIQGTYVWQLLSASLAVVTSGSGDGPVLPTEPGVAASVVYLVQ